MANTFNIYEIYFYSSVILRFMMTILDTPSDTIMKNKKKINENIKNYVFILLVLKCYHKYITLADYLLQWKLSLSLS